MTPDFLTEIINSDLSFMTSKWILEKIPYIFSGNLELYIKWKETLASKLEVDSKAIALTGSSAVGFSLNPENNLREFNDQSDIDVAVISQYFFDVSWHYLRNLGTKIYSLKPKEYNAIEDHRKRLIYWGTIATDKIIQILPFGEKWITSLNQMANIDPTKDRNINLRIYKDYEALRAYQLNNLKQIKDNLISK